ncbi:regulator of initiation factor 2 (eIF2) [Plasmodium brasilianum]|uniref:Regulator of initiation factor 2 (EIF2), putative n=2 Tax=Plasmodium (Plasmodium) TaxID=418103 RepID=A0A1D3PAI2_PLAMA|nr:regulator of initiation factor 2 (eIF2), putative [Plasmodium malariae]KAI4838868.1 regulator of initiation factor 2 (eIF2) [Plasmodium brasilianum]SCN12212.1 regulator of initiation factor 2 (eIF2), putative [Plasmodium malariae]
METSINKDKRRSQSKNDDKGRKKNSGSCLRYQFDEDVILLNTFVYLYLMTNFGKIELLLNSYKIKDSHLGDLKNKIYALFKNVNMLIIPKQSYENKNGSMKRNTKTHNECSRRNDIQFTDEMYDAQRRILNINLNEISSNGNKSNKSNRSGKNHGSSRCDRNSLVYSHTNRNDQDLFFTAYENNNEVKKSLYENVQAIYLDAFLLVNTNDESVDYSYNLINVKIKICMQNKGSVKINSSECTLIDKGWNYDISTIVTNNKEKQEEKRAKRGSKLKIVFKVNDGGTVIDKDNSYNDATDTSDTSDISDISDISNTSNTSNTSDVDDIVDSSESTNDSANERSSRSVIGSDNNRKDGIHHVSKGCNIITEEQKKAFLEHFIDIIQMHSFNKNKKLEETMKHIYSKLFNTQVLDSSDYHIPNTIKQINDFFFYLYEPDFYNMSIQKRNKICYKQLYDQYNKIMIKSKTVKLNNEIIKYLLSDYIFLPKYVQRNKFKNVDENMYSSFSSYSDSLSSDGIIRKVKETAVEMDLNEYNMNSNHKQPSKQHGEGNGTICSNQPNIKCEGKVNRDTSEHKPDEDPSDNCHIRSTEREKEEEKEEKGDGKGEVKYGGKDEVKDDGKDEVKDDGKDEVKDDGKDEVKDDGKDEVKDDGKRNIKDDGNDLHDSENEKRNDKLERKKMNSLFCNTQFRRILEKIKNKIEELNNSVFLRVNYKNLKKGSFVNNFNLEVNTLYDALLMLKSCTSVYKILKENKNKDIYLILSKYVNINICFLFEVYVYNKRIIAVTQKNLNYYFNFLNEADVIIDTLNIIKSFYDKNLKNSFAYDHYIFQLYIHTFKKNNKKKKVILINAKNWLYKNKHTTFTNKFLKNYIYTGNKGTQINDQAYAEKGIYKFCIPSSNLSSKKGKGKEELKNADIHETSGNSSSKYVHDNSFYFYDNMLYYCIVKNDSICKKNANIYPKDLNYIRDGEIDIDNLMETIKKENNIQ